MNGAEGLTDFDRVRAILATGLAGGGLRNGL